MLLAWSLSKKALLPCLTFWKLQIHVRLLAYPSALLEPLMSNYDLIKKMCEWPAYSHGCPGGPCTCMSGVSCVPRSCCPVSRIFIRVTKTPPGGNVRRLPNSIWRLAIPGTPTVRCVLNRESEMAHLPHRASCQALATSLVALSFSTCSYLPTLSTRWTAHGDVACVCSGLDVPLLDLCLGMGARLRIFECLRRHVRVCAVVYVE